MRELKKYQKIGLLGLLIGLALFIYLIHKTGVATIVASVRLLGAGFLLLLLTSGARHFLRTVAWYHSIEKDHRRFRFLELFNIRLAGETVTDLTLAGPFLGETAKAFLVSRRISAPHALSSIVIENLLYSLSVALFILSGVLIFLANFAVPEQIRIASLLVALAILLPVVAVYLIIRQRWMLLSRLFDHLREKKIRWSFLERQEGKIREFEENIYDFYSKHRSLFFCVLLLELLASFTGVIEAYIILDATTTHTSLLAAFLIEVVNRLINVIFAFVPLRVGVEEGGAALTLRALGYSVGEGVSLAIIRKIRTLFWIAFGLLIFARYSLAHKREDLPGASVTGSAKKRLIVNADDFGLTEKVNQAIVEGHQRGIITSTSLLANGAAFESAVALARLAPGLGVGVHLNLTEGRPISDPASIPSLVNEHGHFSSGPVALSARIMVGRVRLEEVEKELRAQIEKVLAAGIAPTHLDGHKHFHVLPPVFRIIMQLASDYGIRGVRCAAEPSARLGPLLRRNRASSAEILKQYLAGRALRFVSSGLKEELERAELSCPEYFYGVTQTGFLDAQSLEEILHSLPWGTSELMCHPGYVDTDLMRTPTRLLAQREVELHALTQPAIKELIVRLGIELITYRNLAEAA